LTSLIVSAANIAYVSATQSAIATIHSNVAAR